MITYTITDVNSPILLAAVLKFSRLHSQYSMQEVSCVGYFTVFKSNFGFDFWSTMERSHLPFVGIFIVCSFERLFLPEQRFERADS